MMVPQRLPQRRPLCRGTAGFTLLELVLATTLSMLVIGILAAALGFSLRVWERQQGKQRDSTTNLIALLQQQMATFNPAPIAFNGQSKPLFRGDAHTLVFATDTSVRAISRGIPVVARYVFTPQDKTLYYAELPLDPYHPEAIQQFLQTPPGRAKGWPQFYATAIAGFSLSYGGEKRSAYQEAWTDEDNPPTSVLISWSDATRGTPMVSAAAPNGLFARSLTPNQANQPMGRPRPKGGFIQ